MSWSCLLVGPKESSVRKQPGDPAWYAPAVRLVLGPELTVQSGLLVQKDEDVKDDEEHARVGEDENAPEEERLRDDERENGDVTRVSDGTEGAADDEMTRRRDRRRRSLALADEAEVERDEER